MVASNFQKPIKNSPAFFLNHNSSLIRKALVAPRRLLAQRCQLLPSGGSHQILILKIFLSEIGSIAKMAEPEDDEPAETSLRQWLDRPGRPIDRYECLHIFQQIVEAVDLARAQGVAVGNIRPSCFVVSVLNQVAFIEPDSCSGSGSLDVDTDVGGSGSSSSRVRFPLKQVLMLEDEWYASPEGGGFSSSSRFASDIYQLGVLLFELFCSFDSMDEKVRSMSNLRQRVLPPHMLLKWPKEASFCLWLLHPQPESRPEMRSRLRHQRRNEY